MKTYTLDQLARFIDHTNLKANVTREDMIQLCNEAKTYHFKMVAINQVQSKLCATLLTNTDIHVGAAIGFPLGQTSIKAKCFETEDAIAQGATEIDYMINITELKAKNYEYVKQEMQAIVDICKKHEIPSKVIFENCYLTKEEIIKVAEIAAFVKPTFIKTSTGFGTSGATVEDVKLMKDVVQDKVEVKAAGGIRDVDTFFAMIQAGATRIGTSAGIAIIEALKATGKTEFTI